MMGYVMQRTMINRTEWLESSAAKSYLRCLANGAPLGVTDAGRTNAEQWILWNEYKAGKLKATAAYPGTSKHETGLALDLPSVVQAWFNAHGSEYGWVKNCVPREPWHYEYRLNFDTHLIDNFPGDDMYTDADRARVQEIHSMLGAGGARVDIRDDETIGYRVRDIQMALTAALPALLANTSAETVANAIPEGIAREVIAILSTKLAGA